MALAVKRDARMGVAEDMRWLKPCPDEGRAGTSSTVLRAPPRARLIVLNGRPKSRRDGPRTGRRRLSGSRDPQRRDRR